MIWFADGILRRNRLSIHIFSRNSCRLSHPCTLLKPFDGFTIWRVHSRGPMTQLCCLGSLTQRGRKDLGVERQPKLAIANCCCHVANINEKCFRFLQNYFGPCYLLVPLESSVLVLGFGSCSHEERIRGYFNVMRYLNSRFTHLLTPVPLTSIPHTDSYTHCSYQLVKVVTLWSVVIAAHSRRTSAIWGTDANAEKTL